MDKTERRIMIKDFIDNKYYHVGDMELHEGLRYILDIIKLIAEEVCDDTTTREK